MRRLLLAAMVLGAVQSAEAADLPDVPVLRGAFTDGLTTSRVNWQGFYVGAQAGYGSSDENFNGSTSNMIAALLANNIIESQMGVSQSNFGLGKQSARSSAFGGFAGYNLQWEDVVVGLEASYLHGTFGGSATASKELSSIAPLSDKFFHDVLAISSASIYDLLAHDLLTATLWLDVRKSQDPSRNFGDGPTAAWAAFRKIVPLLPDMEGVPTQSRPMAAAAFLKSTPANTFFGGGETMPRSSENP